MDTSNTVDYGNSSYWIGKYSNSDDNSLSTNESKKLNLYKLAAHKRAIANFVSILTSQQIPVKFLTSGNSYTDGNSIVISSKLDNPSEFDVAVGLALHEASHIKLSSFEFLHRLETEIYNIDDYITLRDICKLHNINMISNLKDILNWVEDRRIDDFIFKTSPGYRNYYHSLYDKYFNDTLIEKALKSKEFTDETFDSYMFRLINLQSESTRLNALKGLKAIYSISDLENIDRLKTTEDAFNVAVSIFRVILNSINPPIINSNESPQSTNSNPPSGKVHISDADFDKMMDEMEAGDDDETNKSDGDSDIDSSIKSRKSDSSDEAGSDEAGSDEAVEVVLTERQRSILDTKIQKQRKFLNGDILKGSISKSDNRSIETIEKASAEIVEVGSTYNQRISNPYPKTVNCIFIQKMTRELIESNEFPLTKKTIQYSTGTVELMDSSSEAVNIGIKLGTILGSKLQTHSEIRETIFNRQAVGKLDRRMISSLGFGGEQVFYTNNIDSHNKANLHISVDASSSMGEYDKWRNTMINVVALAKAIDMIPTLDLQITFRTVDTNKLPYIVLAYDSRKDKFIKIKTLFQYLSPYGTTPEGLCFEAIMKHMIYSSNNLDSYFLNISDGEPFYISHEFSYSGYDAAVHTKSMINNIKKCGIRVLSYFVGSGSAKTDSASKRIFTESYGDSAKFIDVTSVNEISRTMNKLFLQK